MRIDRATVEDAKEILDLQKLAYQSEAEIYNDYTIPPLTQTLEEMPQYGTTEGLPALRNELAEWARREEGIPCNLDEIIVTHGSQQAMDLASRVFIEPGDIVMVELPTYFGGTGAIHVCGGLTVGVPLDENGMDTEPLAEKIKQLRNVGSRVKGVYVIPNFQNPTGATLSLSRRRRLLELAERYDFMIFEDDPYGDIRFEGERIPSLKALDISGHGIHMHSLSKTFVPGMRLAWVVGEAGVIRKMAIAKQFVDSCTNTLAQYILLEFIRRGLLREKIKHNIAHYRKKT
jgi:2-aminoadipate transaminase